MGGEVRRGSEAQRASDARSAHQLGTERPGSTEATSMQHPILTPHDGGGDPEAPIREAYAHVASGYRAALKTQGLPSEERASLRAVLLAVLQIAEQPPLSCEQSPSAAPRRSLQAG